MVAQRVVNAYKTAEKQAEIHPVKLIHMMYERAIVHLELTEEGLREQNPGKRGENLGKAIAIITELLVAVKSDDHSEAAEFLRGLYSAILSELPRVAMSGDVKVLRLAKAYLEKLKQIWEDTAMHDAGEPLAQANKTEVSSSPPHMGLRESYDSCRSRMAVAGLSFSI